MQLVFLRYDEEFDYMGFMSLDSAEEYNQSPHHHHMKASDLHDNIDNQQYQLKYTEFKTGKEDLSWALPSMVETVSLVPNSVPQ